LVWLIWFMVFSATYKNLYKYYGFFITYCDIILFLLDYVNISESMSSYVQKLIYVIICPKINLCHRMSKN